MRNVPSNRPRTPSKEERTIPAAPLPPHVLGLLATQRRHVPLLWASKPDEPGEKRRGFLTLKRLAMEYNDYLKKLSEMIKRHNGEIRRLQQEYAYAQSPYKVGDYVTDHIGTIKVEKIQWQSSDMGKDVTCVYFGQCYTRKKEPFKSGETRFVFQKNIGL
jgi:hypothetical protein